jgi:hypothetical protein
VVKATPGCALLFIVAQVPVSLTPSVNTQMMHPTVDSWTFNRTRL